MKNSIRELSDLLTHSTAGSGRLVAAILAMKDENNFVTYDYKLIAKAGGVGIRTVRKSIRGLSSQGYIRVVDEYKLMLNPHIIYYCNEPRRDAMIERWDSLKP